MSKVDFNKLVWKVDLSHKESKPPIHMIVLFRLEEINHRDRYAYFPFENYVDAKQMVKDAIEAEIKDLKWRIKVLDAYDPYADINFSNYSDESLIQIREEMDMEEDEEFDTSDPKEFWNEVVYNVEEHIEENKSYKGFNGSKKLISKARMRAWVEEPKKYLEFVKNWLKEKVW